MATKIAEKAKIMEMAAKIKDENGIAIEITESQKRIKKESCEKPFLFRYFCTHDLGLIFLVLGKL
jgi:maltose-binding protein MalE